MYSTINRRLFAQLKERDTPKEPTEAFVSTLTCGRRIVYPKCPVCAYTMNDWDRFCRNCGQRIKADVPFSANKGA